MQYFKLASLLALSAALVGASTFADIQNDVSTIDSDVSQLKTALSSNSINYFTALQINQEAQALDQAVQKGTSDANAYTGTVTDAQAQGILNTLTGTETNVAYISQRLVALKPQFDSLGVSGLAKSDIDALQTDVDAFGKALVAKTPSAEQAQAQSLADKFNSDLATAAAAYN